MNNFTKALFNGLGGLGAYLCGLNWEIIYIWVLLMTLDIISGVIKAMKNGKFSSGDMRNGLYKKVGETFLVIALILGQRVAMINGINVPIVTILVGGFCFKDLGSIIENALDMEVNIPSIVRKWFKVADESINKDNGK